MSDWKTSINGFIEKLDGWTDRFRQSWRGKKGYKKQLKIVPYLGYGTSEKLYLRGRVIAENREIVSAETDGKRRNLSNFFRRFATDEVPFARIAAEYKGFVKEFGANDEGYFEIEIETGETDATDADFRAVKIELLAPVSKTSVAAIAHGKILVPAKNASFGIISDLDDTVITTDVSSKLKMLFNTAFRNEYTRLPFAGVAEFYAALKKGADGKACNPFFYVSSSPWNLYPVLVEFLRLKNIPEGALFLKDFGNHTIFQSSEHGAHKLENIEKILNTFTALPFVLIGDSGESDPEIYAEIVRKFPNRICVIYIRSVNFATERIASIEKIVAELGAKNCPMILVPDTAAAAEHARANGLIE